MDHHQIQQQVYRTRIYTVTKLQYGVMVIVFELEMLRIQCLFNLTLVMLFSDVNKL